VKLATGVEEVSISSKIMHSKAIDLIDKGCRLFGQYNSSGEISEKEVCNSLSIRGCIKDGKNIP